MPAFILITRRKMSAQAKLVDSFTTACEEANKFVGDHNPTDGCSSLPHVRSKQTSRGSEYSIARSTSFGPRSATVKPIGYDFETSIL